MGFWNDMMNRWVRPAASEPSAAPQSVSQAPSLPKAAKKLFGSLPNDAREEAPVIDFARIEQAFQEESLVMQALTRYVELIFKEEWTLKSRDQKALKYVQRRLEEIGEAMNHPFELFLIELGTNLVKYNNCMFYRMKDKRGHIQSYFVLDTPNTRLYVDKDYRPLLFRQYTISNRSAWATYPLTYQYRDFPAADIHHVHNNRPSGRFFGVPFLLPVIDDIRILREIESALIRSIHKNIEPLVQHIIGDNDRPTTNEEIGMIQSAVENLPMDGQLVTSHRHQIKVHGAQGEALQIEKYLRYFEQRVMTGLGMPETAFGRAATSNKSTAEQLAKELHDRVKSYQRILEIAVNYRIIKDILAEPEAPVAKDKVTLEFNEIDVDFLIKKENQAIFKFVSNATTEDELRHDLGLEPIADKEREKLYGNLYGAASPQEDAANRVAPKNQHGASQEQEADLIHANQDEEELLEAEARIRLRDQLMRMYETIWSEEGFTPNLPERLMEGTRTVLDRLQVVGDRRSYFTQAVERLGQHLVSNEVQNAEDARKVFHQGQYILSRVIASPSMPPQLT